QRRRGASVCSPVASPLIRRSARRSPDPSWRWSRRRPVPAWLGSSRRGASGLLEAAGHAPRPCPDVGGVQSLTALNFSRVYWAAFESENTASTQALPLVCSWTRVGSGPRREQGRRRHAVDARGEVL